jgi:hypothetical protein
MPRGQLAFLALAAALFTAPEAASAGAAGGRAPRGPVIAGRYDSPLGRLEVAGGIDADPDPSTLHDEPGHRALVRARP